MLVLLENSYSHSGLLLNNNANNKCMLHKSANLASLASVPNLINVIEGSIEDYMSFFNADDDEVNISVYRSSLLATPTSVFPNT